MERESVVQKPGHSVMHADRVTFHPTPAARRLPPAAFRPPPSARRLQPSRQMDDGCRSLLHHLSVLAARQGCNVLAEALLVYT